MIGRELNHYTVLSKLGEGGMAEVYRARDNRLGREVALKVLPDETANDTRRLERFEHEAKVVAALNHPNIVTIYSVEEANGVRFFTMELVDGRSLDEIIPKEGLEPSAFFRIALPLLDAVTAAHRRGVTHRDIKPANVMVNSEGVVKLLDLGLAKLNSTLVEGDPEAAVETWTRKGRAIGTVPYMSPEQLSGAEIDHRVDIFSLGVLFYEMLTCRRPFVGASSAEVISSILDDSPNPLTQLRQDLSTSLERVVERCLEKEPSERYQSARELREALVRLAESGPFGLAQASGRETIRARRPPAPANPRHQWLAAGGIAAVVALVVGAFFALRSGDEARPEAPAPTTPLLSLAISPLTFENRGEAPQFAHQLEREIVRRLGRIEGLELVASSSAGATIPPEADYLLWGAVNWLDSSPEGPRVRASFGLLRASDGRDIWTESFDRSPDARGVGRREIALLVESRVGRFLGFRVPEVADLGSTRQTDVGDRDPDGGIPLPGERSERGPNPTRGKHPEAQDPESESPPSTPSPTATRRDSAAAATVPVSLLLRSEIAHGTLTVYADDRQIHRDRFHFTQPKEGVLGRIGARRDATGESTVELELERPIEELRIYVAAGQRPAHQAVLAASNLIAGDRIVVSIAPDGGLGVEVE